ncbi:MAG: hypothetical protein U1C57_01080 [Candidatus Doudnabacteria bacterium]|nr:hypothetical protein [bacterium]MDZ4243678.1 hypothetical protein [Candidatus Doudnabacteria bacterium]
MRQDIEFQTPESSAPPEPVNFFKRHQKRIWATLIVLAVATAGLLAYLLFFRHSDLTPELSGEVKLNLSVPEISSSGSEISYEVDIENFSNSKATKLVLEVFYPKGFEFIDSTVSQPVSAPGSAVGEYRFADLDPGREHHLVIVGRLSGEIQEVKTVTAKLYYEPANFRSSFVVEAQGGTIMQAPELSLTITAPPQTISGQTISYDLQVANISSRPFDQLVLKVAYPEGFQFVSAVPAPLESSKNEWRFATIGINEKQTISITGKNFDAPGQDSFVQAELFVANTQGDLIGASRAYAFTQMRPSPLRLTHNLEEDMGGGQASVGENLKYRVEYENISELGLNNVQIRVIFESPGINFLEVEGGEGQQKNNTLVWSPITSPSLGVVQPGSRGDFAFTLRLTDGLAKALQKNPVLRTRVEYSADELTETVAGNGQEIKVATQVSINADVIVVGGENPPVRGKFTTYRVTLSIVNTVNDIVDAELAGYMLRVDSEFFGNSISPAAEAGNVTFTGVPGVLRWKAGRVFAFSGSFHEARNLSFDITSSDPAFMRDVQVLGRDEFTGEPVFSENLELSYQR